MESAWIWRKETREPRVQIHWEVNIPSVAYGSLELELEVEVEQREGSRRRFFCHERLRLYTVWGIKGYGRLMVDQVARSALPTGAP